MITDRFVRFYLSSIIYQLSSISTSSFNCLASNNENYADKQNPPTNPTDISVEFVGDALTKKLVEVMPIELPAGELFCAKILRGAAVRRLRRLNLVSQSRFETQHRPPLEKPDLALPQVGVAAG